MHNFRLPKLAGRLSDIIITFCKLLVGSLLASYFLYALFIPFLNLYISSPLKNPWQFAIEHGIPNAFPYGPVMFYIMVIPRVLFLWAIPSDPFAVTWVHLLLARIPLIIADGAILWMLVRFLETDERRARLLWWTSPIVFYITYVHGQLDIIPTAILMASLVLLVQGRYTWSAVVLGLGIGAKSHLFVAFPFLVMFTVRKETSWKRGFMFLFITLFIYVACLFPWVLNEGFRKMVFGTEEQGRIFKVGLDYLPTLRVFLAPLAIGLLFLRFAIYRKVNQDTLFMFLGLAYTVLISLLPPAHGYYIWPLPFVIYFFARQIDYSRLPLWTFNISCLAYLLLGLDSTLFDSMRIIFPQVSNWGASILILKRFGIGVSLINSFLFTIMQTSILMMALMMYRHGVLSNIIYKPKKQPVIIGIGGDSGSGKHTARDVISDVLGHHNILSVDGDDVHRWERGHEMWKVVSHLHPEGNNLYIQMEHAKALGQGKAVKKTKYDHTTGRFTQPVQVPPNRYICFVGLHPFYLKRMREMIDIKIYMDTDEELRREWKTNRDVEKRGYTKEQVVDQIKMRENDGQRFIVPQKAFADMLAKYYRAQASCPPDESAGRLGISIRLDNSLELMGLVARLKELAGVFVKLDLEDDLLYQTLIVEGYVTPQQVIEIGKEILPELNELIATNAVWRGGPEGILQLCFLMLLSDLLLNRSDITTN